MSEKRSSYVTSFVPVTVQEDDKAAFERSGYALREACRLFGEWAAVLSPEDLKRFKGVKWTLSEDGREKLITLLEREP